MGNVNIRPMAKGFVKILLILLVTALIAGCGGGGGGRNKKPEKTYMRAGNYYVLRSDFHIHTTKSDGKVNHVQRVYEADEYGYDVIALTDHASWGGYNTAAKIQSTYYEALSAARNVGLILVRGLETGINSAEHIVALNLPLSYEPFNEHKWTLNESDEQYYRKRMKAIADAGGILIYAHPDFPGALKVRTNGYRAPIAWGIEQGYIQGVEVRNDTIVTFAAHENMGTFKDAFRWALDHDLIIFANTDVHKTRAEEMENGKPTYTLVLATAPTESAVVDALRDRRTIAWFQDMLWGREEHLTIFFDGLVDVRMNANSNGLVIENDSYAKLEGRVIDGYINGVRHEIGKDFTLMPEGTANVSIDAEYDYVNIEWKNAYKEPDVTFTLRYDI